MSETLYFGNKNIAGVSNITASAFYGTFVGSASQLTGIPTGPTGPQGVTGPTGITGPTGFTGPGYGPYQTAAGVSLSPIVGGSVLVTLTDNTQSAFFVNQQVRVAINTTTYFDGTITNIAGLNYTVLVDFTTTASATGQWKFGLTGQRGAIGWTGPTGPAPTGSAGGVVYLTASQLSAATLPADLYWDNANGRLGVKQAAPANTLDVTGNARITTDLTLGNPLAIASGGTSTTTRQGAMNVLAGSVVSGSYLRGDGTNILMSVIQNADLPATISRTNIAGTTSVVGPIVGSNSVAASSVTASGIISGSPIVGQISGSNTINASTITASGAIAGNPLTGQILGSNSIGCTSITASSMSLTTALPIGSGGTGASTKSAAFDALSPMTTAGDIIYGGASGTGTRLATGTATQLLHGGSTPTWSAIALDQDVTNQLPIANGGTGSSSAQGAINALVGTQTANRVLRSNGTNMLLAQVGLTTDVTGTLPIANGGTNATTQQAAINSLVGTQTANRVLRSDGTNMSLAQVGLTTDVTGTLPFANGGTNATTRQAALNSLAGAQTSANFLRGDGTNVSMSAIQASDVPTLNQNTTGSAASATNATFATSSTNATFATSATSATNATFATSSTNATFATSATNATFATSATNATSSTQLGGLTKSQLFNNSGQNHTTYGTFASLNSVDFGKYFAQAATDGPNGNGQYYVTNQGLGNDYAYTSYAMQTALQRNTTGYFWVRWRENGTWGGWSKIYAGFADSATSATNATYATSAGSATNASNFSGGAINATTGAFSSTISGGSSSFGANNIDVQNNSGFYGLYVHNDTGGGGAFSIQSRPAQAHGSNTSWGCNFTLSARFNASPFGWSQLTSTQQNGASARMIIDGTPVQISRLTTNGTVLTSGSNGTLSVSSDRRLKTDIEYITEEATSKILALKPATFRFKTSPGDKHIGFIAQDVEEHIPLAVDGKKHEYEWKQDDENKPVLDSNGNMVLTDQPRYRGLSDRALIAMLVKSVQELESRIRTLESGN